MPPKKKADQAMRTDEAKATRPKATGKKKATKTPPMTEEEMEARLFRIAWKNLGLDKR